MSLADDRPSHEDAAAADAAHLAVVRDAWQSVLDVPEVADDVTFFDAGGDSLRLVVLVERLNQATGRSLRTIDLFRAGTVRGHAGLLSAPEQAAGPASAGRGASRRRLLEAARTRAARPTRP